jgi:hypothetical protein
MSGPQGAQKVLVGRVAAHGIPGYDSAGIALVGPTASLSAQEGGQAEQPRGGARRSSGRRRTTWASGTPAGPPTARPPTPTRTRTCRQRPRRAHPQRHHRELRRPCAPNSSPPGSRSPPRPTPRSPPSCIGREVEGRASGLADAMRTVSRRLEGAFTLVAMDAHDPGHVLVASRRNSPLVVGVGEGEMFVASDVAAFIEHTREAVEMGQDEVVEVTAPAPEGHRLRGNETRASPTTSTGTSRPPRRVATTGSCARRSTSSRRPSPTPCWAASTPTAADARRDPHLEPSCAPSTRSSSSPAARPTTPAWSPSTPSSTGRGSPARSRSPPSSATATRSSPPARWSSPSPSPARPPTR